jgi:putative ABC transport system permease protein
MRIGDGVALARASLAAHRLRTALSALGIVAGVATVIAALAVGEGARRQAEREIGRLGVRNIYVMPSGKPALPMRAVAALEGLRDVTRAAASRRAMLEVSADLKSQRAPVAGVTTSLREVAELAVGNGRWLLDSDDRSNRRVAVVGADLAIALFGARDPIGSRVTVSGTTFVVVGVLSGASRTSGAAPVPDPAATVFIPIAAMRFKMFAADRGEGLSDIVVQAQDGADVEDVAVRARRALGRLDPMLAHANLVVPRALLAARVRSGRAFQAMVGAIGALVLFVSGIGIMNIMLASVTERTPEVGVRRAFGATRRDIACQFAIEAVTLCGMGGAAGVPLGVAAACLLALARGWPIAISGASVVVALAAACAVGVAFGLYPAIRAARITPIDAIRAL